MRLFILSAKMLLFFSHNLDDNQIQSAKNDLGISEFVTLPEHIQSKWSNVPADLADLNAYSSDFKEFLNQNSRPNDIALIQGDFGLSYIMINYAKSLGLHAVYATTRRISKEKIINGKTIKESVFEHVRFRQF